MTDELMLPGHESTLRETAAAADFALPGLEADAEGISPWAPMTRAYEAIARAVADCARGGNWAAMALDLRFRSHAANVRLAAAIGRAEWREDRDVARADGEPSSAWVRRADRSPEVDLARRRIGAALEAGFDDSGLDETLIVALAEAVLDFLLRAQEVLRSVSEAERQSDRHNPLRGVAQRRLASLLGELGAAFGLVIEVDEGSLAVWPGPRFNAPATQVGTA